jgi:TIGR03009 family protein
MRMSFTARAAFAILMACFLSGSVARAQVPQQPAAGQTAPTAPLRPQLGVAAQAAVAPQQLQPPQPPPGFALNQLQQAYLHEVLDKWQMESGKINTFKCAFERWEYNPVFGPVGANPGERIPLNKDKGELSFQKPDKGSFQITAISTWKAAAAAPPPAAGQPPAPAQGNWELQPKAIGEHWVCDGKSVFEYRHDQQQVVERPIPVELQGKAIVDGPLPFLFGADAARLKQRYWMRVEQQPNNEEIWLTAMPKFQADAANFTAVQVILDRQRLLPKAMRVALPDKTIHMYIFDVANATVNSPIARLQSLFQRPRVPSGWKLVVEQAPIAQAAQPAPAPR